MHEAGVPRGLEVLRRESGPSPPGGGSKMFSLKGAASSSPTVKTCRPGICVRSDLYSLLTGSITRNGIPSR